MRERGQEDEGRVACAQEQRVSLEARNANINAKQQPKHKSLKSQNKPNQKKTGRSAPASTFSRSLLCAPPTRCTTCGGRDRTDDWMDDWVMTEREGGAREDSE